MTSVYFLMSAPRLITPGLSPAELSLCFASQKTAILVEVAMAGHDSVIGFPGIVRKNEAPFRAQAQVAGETLRVSARVLQAAIKRESQIYLPLLDHTHILSEQIAQAAVCNHFHTIDQRLARWLLFARDRTRNSAFKITHEAIAQILGVSRSGVSSAAGLLQMKGLIRYARGRITLLNPQRTRRIFLRMLPNSQPDDKLLAPARSSASN